MNLQWALSASKSRARAHGRNEWVEASAALESLPVSRARPAWMRNVDASHKLFERGGFFVCSRCGALGSYKPQRLFNACEGTGGSKAEARRLLHKAELPRGYTKWPNNWKGENKSPPLFRVVWN